MFLEILKKHITDHGLYCLPLEGTLEGACSCGSKTCTSRGKHPTKRFFWSYSSRNEKQKVTGWFDNCPNPHNIGVLTGRKSKINGKYLVVIDIDYACPELVEKLPPTFSYKTGKPDGIHLWFWSDKRISNSVGLLAPKVDIRGENGYVVVPPSRHQTGNIYTVLNDLEIADLPVWVSEILETNRKSIKRDSKEQKTVKSKANKSKLPYENWTVLDVDQIEEKLELGELIPVGQRNNIVFKLLTAKKISGVEDEQLIEYAIGIASRVEDPESYSEQELHASIRSVGKITTYKKDITKFNENYVKFIKNTFYTQKQLDVELYTKTLDDSDNEFFGLLTPEQDKKKFVLLKDLMELRLNWLKQVKGLEHVSKYGTNSFAEKLILLEFNKHRTSKNCFWNVNFDKVTEQLNHIMQTTSQTTNNMFKGTPVEVYVLPSVITIFVTDFFKEEVSGGAELTTQAIIDVCPTEQKNSIAKIHSVSLTPKMLTNLSKRLIKPTLVFCNFSQVDGDVLKHLAETKCLNYVVVEYDLKYCAYRSEQLHFLQTNGAGCDCKETQHGKTMAKFYSSASHVFWMAEKQIELYETKLGIKLKNKSTVLSSCFTDEQLDLLLTLGKTYLKENKLAVLGSGSWIKGIKESEAWCKVHNKSYATIPALDYFSFIKKLAGLKGLVFKPLDYDTCPRLVIEAKILGLDLYLNNNVLHKNESWFQKTPEEIVLYLKNNKIMFWNYLLDKQC